MSKIRAAAYAGLRKGLRQPGELPKKKKKVSKQLSSAEIARLRRIIAKDKDKASEVLY